MESSSYFSKGHRVIIVLDLIVVTVILIIVVTVILIIVVVFVLIYSALVFIFIGVLASNVILVHIGLITT